ncbi:substrate-binding domain-containing protein [Paracoccus sp. MKU1]|uniref:substrate-binding domain-containing protein n=1 Tax=Paracoccus sp. MKU1 TaxID=1745182 RepID=UPI0009E773B9|nr:substrate-binding domain-containing protein [Paracoccus sp. MKU1]
MSRKTCQSAPFRVRDRKGDSENSQETGEKLLAKPKSQAIQARRIRPTIHDVAKAAGVSIATVSRALNSPDSVRKELRERVVAAADSMDYMADSVGKALRRQRTQIISTMLPRLADPLFSAVASAIQETLEENGYLGFVQTSGFDNTNLFDRAKRLIEHGTEGLIIFGRIDDQRLLDYCRAHQLPLLSAYSYFEKAEVPTIGFDNYLATRQLVEMLHTLGHSRIAMISGSDKGNDRQQSRIRAFRDINAELGQEPVIEFTHMDFDMADGGAALRRIMENHPETTALVCNRCVIAFSVMVEARRLGIAVPEHLSLTGFDDIDYAALFDPSLTTVAVPSEKIGRAAAKAMIAHLETGAPLGSRRFETEVILRRSVARPRATA